MQQRRASPQRHVGHARFGGVTKKGKANMTDNRITRRQQLALAASAAAAGMFPIHVRAQQNYPNRIITCVFSSLLPMALTVAVGQL
jgi:hypothetical protein